MDDNEIIGFLNNLVQNSSKDINNWDSSEFDEFMDLLSKGLGKVRRGDLNF